MSAIREFAPAKVNLTLEVRGKRADGYHEIESLVAFANIGDLVSLDTAKPFGVTTSGPFASAISGTNLVDTALAMLRDLDPGLLLGEVNLEKYLPIASGLGGGSADAAAVLRAVRRANPGRAELLDWNRLAQRLGADVPVCLTSRLCWMTGLGETVKPLETSEPVSLYAVIVNPNAAVPGDKTARVFKALMAPQLSQGFKPTEPAKVGGMVDVWNVVSSGLNALEFPARTVVPEVDGVLEELEKARGRRLARMSGGGPSCFALFDTMETAAAAANDLREAHPDWWIEETILT